MAMDGKLIAFHCFGTPVPVLTDDERAVLQVLKDARGIFAGEGPNGGMRVFDIRIRADRPLSTQDITKALTVLEANGRARKLPNDRWAKS